MAALLVVLLGAGGCSAGVALPIRMEVGELQLPPIPTALGEGRPVVIRVIDERPTRALGRRLSTAPILGAEDLPAVLAALLGKGLSALGYRVLGVPQADATTPMLTVRLREFTLVDTSGPSGLQWEARALAITVVSLGGRVVLERGHFQNRAYPYRLWGALFQASPVEELQGTATALAHGIIADLEVLEALRVPVVAEATAVDPSLGRLRTARVVAIAPTVQVPEQVMRRLAEWITALLPAPGALRDDLVIEYRVVRYQPEGTGILAVEAHLRDGAGREVATVNAQGSKVHRDLLTPMGTRPFDLAVLQVAERIVADVRTHFLKVPD